MRIWWQRLTALVAAALVTTFLASLGHSIMVQRELVALGVEIPFGTRMLTMLRDFAGLVPALGGVLSGALLVAFIIASFLKPRSGMLGPLAYPLAGWAAVALALFVMQAIYGFSPLAGARTPGGFLLVSLSGLVGGGVYAWVASRRPATTS